MAYRVGKMRFRSSLVAGESLLAAEDKAAAAAELLRGEVSAFFCERLVGAVEMTVIVEHIARNGNPVVIQEVSPGKGDVPPAVLQTFYNVAFVGSP